MQELSTDNINIKKSLSESIEDTMFHSSFLQDRILELEIKTSVMEQQARHCKVEISDLP